MNVLHVDASILGEHSVSRALTSAIVARLKGSHPGARVTYRDLASEPVPQLSSRLVAAGGTPPDQLDEELRRETALLQAALDEVLAADVIVVGAPMYNFGIPSQLKSWVDALAVPGKTFRYTTGGAEGLLGAKELIIASTQGGFYKPGTPMASFDHQEAHLRSFFHFLGVTEIRVVRADGIKVGPDGPERVREAVREASMLEVA